MEPAAAGKPDVGPELIGTEVEGLDAAAHGVRARRLLLLLLSVLQNLYGVMARTNTLVDGEMVPNLDGVGGTKEVEAASPIHRPKPIGNDTRCG